MSNNYRSVPFIQQLRQQWLSQLIGADQVMEQLNDYELDTINRNDEELDAAWELRQDIEHSHPALKTPAELELLLGADIVQHIKDMMLALAEIAGAGRLNDDYATVAQFIATQAASGYRDQLRALLHDSGPNMPQLQEVLRRIEAAVADEPQPDPLNPPQATSEEPWLVAQYCFAQGNWDQARSALGRMPQTHPRFPEAASMLWAIADAEIYDLVPELRTMPAYLASLRSFRAWGAFKKQRAEAERLIAEASTKAGRQIATPRSLIEIFEDAARGEDAEHLVAKARTHIRRGEFNEATTLLMDAEALDTRYPQVLLHDMISDLAQTTRALRHNELSTAAEMIEARRLCHTLLDEYATPDSQLVLQISNQVVARIDSAVSSAWAYFEARMRAINAPDTLENKLHLCDLAAEKLADIEFLHNQHSDLAEAQQQLDQRRQKLEYLKRLRDTMHRDIATLDAVHLHIQRAEGLAQQLVTLAAEPLLSGDEQLIEAARAMTGRLTEFLNQRLVRSERTLSQVEIDEAAVVLSLAQLGPSAITPASVVLYTNAMQNAHRRRTRLGPRIGAFVGRLRHLARSGKRPAARQDGDWS